MKNFIILRFLTEGVLITLKIILAILNLIEDEIYKMEYAENFDKLFNDFIDNPDNN